jgi:short-subunit dehydrogenase
LAKCVVRDMAARDEGRILLTSSIASTMPGSFQAVYNASKSFVQSFALALRNELKDTNVTVTSLMPGPTDTEFFEMAGKERAVSAWLSTKLPGHGSRLMPDRVKAELHRKMAEPGTSRARSRQPFDH